MSQTLISPTSDADLPHPAHRRPLWRQRLVQAERGLSWGLKGDSIFYLYAFAGSIVTMAGLVVGLGLLHWALLALAWSGVVAAEMFFQVIKLLAQTPAGETPERLRKALAGAQAAVMLAIAGALAAVGLVFAERVQGLWS